MSKKDQIRKSFQKLAKQIGPAPTMLAKVSSVNEDEATCSIDDDGFIYFDVQLKPVVSNAESVLAIPKVGTWVLVARIEEDDDWFVLAAQEVDKYTIRAGSLEFVMKDGMFLIKKDEENLGKLMDDLFAAILAEKHTTPSGPSTGLIPTSATQFNLLRDRFKNFLSNA